MIPEMNEQPSFHLVSCYLHFIVRVVVRSSRSRYQVNPYPDRFVPWSTNTREILSYTTWESQLVTRHNMMFNDFNVQIYILNTKYVSGEDSNKVEKYIHVSFKSLSSRSRIFAKYGKKNIFICNTLYA